MEKFSKSILNYFAAYTETRFNFRTKKDYIWTDDALTAELSVFPEFQKKILDSVKNKGVLNLTVKKDEYVVLIDSDIFKQALLKEIETNFGIKFLQSCVKQSRERLSISESDTVIVAGDEDRQGNIKVNPEFEKRVLQEGFRQFNLALRNIIEQILVGLQRKKIEELQAEIKFTLAPPTTLNSSSFTQEIYDSIKTLINGATNEDAFLSSVKQLITKNSYDLKMYDLYSTIRKFTRYVGMGTSYLFFHEIYLSQSEAPIEKYPIFLIEVEIKDSEDAIVLSAPRNLLLINVPAINSMGFGRILTTPRAARLIEAKDYLWGVEKFLQNSYDFFESFLLQYAFRPLLAQNCPKINFRIGLQVVQQENRKLLDYSELITRIDAGQGGNFINFVKDYVSGNVKNTADEIETEYKNRYPKKSSQSILSTIPINLNEAQRRILVALENPKNKIIVVDGPPGTGKSHTIAAITYWANQIKKSIVITSHKKAALDVLDNMLTAKFQQLHPQTKPTIMRISKDNLSKNNPQNTLSGPAIATANRHANEFNEEAVKNDIEQWRNKIEKEISSFWQNSQDYREKVDKLFRLIQIEQDLRNAQVIRDDFSLCKIPADKICDIGLIKRCMEGINRANIDSLSLEQLCFLYNERDSLDKLIAACNTVNNSTLTQSDVDKLKDFYPETIDNLSKIISEISIYLDNASLIFNETKRKYRIVLWLKWFLKKKQLIDKVDNVLKKLNNLEFENILFNIAYLTSRQKNELMLKNLKEGLKKLQEVGRYKVDLALLNSVRNKLNLPEKNIKYLFDLFSKGKKIVTCLTPETIVSLRTLFDYFGLLLKNMSINENNITEIYRLLAERGAPQKLLEYIELFVELSKSDSFTLPERSLISSYYDSIHKYHEFINAKRLKNLNRYSGDIERILVTLQTGKRLKENELNVLLENISCIISEPDMISLYFPMKEESIDILVIDEASQVSIAESISLILRAKQVVVFGDELQYGAVSTINVNKEYRDQYFREILDNYEKDFRTAINRGEKEKLVQEEMKDVDNEEQEIEPVYKPEEGTKEWLKTFSIRTSTLNFAKAIKNYSTSLDTHFRSFAEIIHYSNEKFYKPSQIPLIINRIRTKPIKQVLRFIKVDTQGNSGRNVNLDEIDVIKKDIENLIANGFKGTIGIITSFREQRDRTEEVLRAELPNYYTLEKNHKLAIWFVGDVQGEERDIVYYSFVEDKNINNGSLKMIYPIIGGSADNIRNLKMQRLNVGFSRAKDTMVFVHSMPIEDYSDTRLGEALKMYKQQYDYTIDNFIEDESIFGSPKEKELYQLIINTKFYQKNRDKIKIIAQFPIGEYIRETYHRYIPKYRTDFLITLFDGGKEQSLILEYDGLEYHTQNPEIVTKHNFSQEYLEYDIQRQLELENYGYKFLRINKFSLIPKDKSQTKIDVLGSLLENKFVNQ